jgi:hypothetical protein
VSVDGAELADGWAEGGVTGLRDQGPRGAQEALSRGPEAVEDHGSYDLDEHPRDRARGYGRGRDERRPRNALGGEAHQSQRYARPVGEADEGDGFANALGGVGSRVQRTPVAS